MTTSQLATDVSQFLHGMFVTSMWLAQCAVPFVTMLLALRAL